MTKDTFPLTENTFFYATSPLRFSFDCLAVKHTRDRIEESLINASKELSRSRNSFSETMALILIAPFLIVPVLLVTHIAATPSYVAEFVTGLLTIVPAIAVAIAALPFIALICLGEALANLICSNDDIGLIKSATA